MPKYTVRVPMIRVYMVDVEADSPTDAIKSVKDMDEAEYGEAHDSYLEDSIDEEMDVMEVEE